MSSLAINNHKYHLVFFVAPGCCIPQPILQFVGATSFTVTWNREPCLSRNGADIHYIARYFLTGFRNIIDSKIVAISNMTFTATSLTPRTSYTFEVAFVNQVGSGPYTNLSTNTFGLPCE